MLFFFFARSASKMCLTLFQKVKKRFQTIKNRKFKKSKKSGFFQRGQSMVLVKNLKFFSSFYCRLNRPGKRLLIFQKGKRRFFYSEIKVKKVEILVFFQRGQSIVFTKKLKFFHLFIFGKIGQENVFEDIVGRKKAF